MIAAYAFVPDELLLDPAEVAAFRAETAWGQVRVATEVNRPFWNTFLEYEDWGSSSDGEGSTWFEADAYCGYLWKKSMTTMHLNNGMP